MSFRFPKLRGKHAKQPVGIFVTFSVLVSSLFVSPLLIPDQEAEASSIEQDYAISFDGTEDASTGENWLGVSGPSELTVALWAKYEDSSPSGNDTIFRLGYSSRTTLYVDDGKLKFNGDVNGKCVVDMQRTTSASYSAGSYSGTVNYSGTLCGHNANSTLNAGFSAGF